MRALRGINASYTTTGFCPTNGCSSPEWVNAAQNGGFFVQPNSGVFGSVEPKTNAPPLYPVQDFVAQLMLKEGGDDH